MSSRNFTAERAAQGFCDQAHLDAFYVYFDHTKACTDCGAGPAVFIDDSWQGTFALCPVARALVVMTR